jgi:hypothetical protein
MTQNRRLRCIRRAVLLGTALLPLAPAFAESRVIRGAGTIGYYIGEDGVLQNKVNGSALFPDPLTMRSYLTCVAPEPGAVGCSFDPALLPTPTHWYQRENLPTSAAAEAQADWGVARVRTFSGGATPGEIQLPTGRRSYLAGATVEWQESITYVAPTPGLVTFEVRLHASWNDYGRINAYGGIPNYEPDAADWIDGQVYDNCVRFAPGSCAGRFEGEYSFIAGDDAENRAGTVDRLLRFSAIVRPSSDPREEENPTTLVGPTDFLIGVSASSGYPGAEVDAFSTMTLERVILQPGASISFGSGTQYLVTTVPEPGTLALWLAGFGLLAGLRRHRRGGVAA